MVLVACFAGLEQLPVTRSLDNDTYREALSRERAVVEVTAAWCSPCKLLDPHYAAAARQHPDIPFYTLDLDQSLAAAEALGVTSVPTVLVFERGKEVARMSGLEEADAKAIRTLLERIVHPEASSTLGRRSRATSHGIPVPETRPAGSARFRTLERAGTAKRSSIQSRVANGACDRRNGPGRKGAAGT
ncbi:MAG: thioredoxin family protein [Thermoanaerobaculia bacterium]|nr:MAG: thioredoxin family protein [Thermoanaerobaculia bacterium]MBZ0102612.1 thioredoxin family protein [Thermoanaerobaculia bacterium]